MILIEETFSNTMKSYFNQNSAKEEWKNKEFEKMVDSLLNRKAMNSFIRAEKKSKYYKNILDLEYGENHLNTSNLNLIASSSSNRNLSKKNILKKEDIGKIYEKKKNNKRIKLQLVFNFFQI